MPFKKGNKLGGRRKPEAGVDTQKAFLAFLPEAIKTIVALMRSYDDPTRMRAAVHILDRAIGKVADSVELSGKDGGAIQINVNIAEKK